MSRWCLRIADRPRARRHFGSRHAAGALLTVVLALLVGLAAGCSKTDEKPVLKIGLVSPLSGAGINWGYGPYAGLDLVIEDINGKGGLKVGDKSYQLKMIPYDTKYLADEGITAVKRLIFEDKVKIIFGEISSACAMAEQTVTEPQKAILYCDTYTEKLLRADKPFTFRHTTTNVEYAPKMLDVYKEKFPGWKVAAYIYPDDETGNSMYKWLKKYAEERELKEIGVPYERGTKDLTPVVTKAIAAKPDILEIGGSSPADAAQMINIARDMGWTKPITRTSNLSGEELIKICGAKANGVIGIESGDPNDSNPKIQDLFKRWEAKKYPATKNFGVPLYYDQLMLLFTAIQKAGTVDDTDKIRQAMEQTEYEGMTGKLTWTGQKTYGVDHQLLTPTYVVQIQDGKQSVIKVIRDY
jgi:branched-chain amino acid transport system substrate-binding protein